MGIGGRSEVCRFAHQSAGYMTGCVPYCTGWGGPITAPVVGPPGDYFSGAWGPGAQATAKKVLEMILAVWPRVIAVQGRKYGRRRASQDSTTPVQMFTSLVP